MTAETTTGITPSQARASKRGFTLTEIAIVLGIIGLILGAIWVAAAAVYNNMRTTNANRELLQIVQAVRAMYATSSTVDPAASMPPGTAPSAGAQQTYIRAGVFPADALDSGLASTATKAINPWNGNIAIAAATQNIADDAFSVSFDALPSQACINMLTSASGQGRDPGMFAAGGGPAGGTGTQNTLPATGILASTAQGQCDNTGGNAATFWFSLRASN